MSCVKILKFTETLFDLCDVTLACEESQNLHQKVIPGHTKKCVIKMGNSKENFIDWEALAEWDREIPDNSPYKYLTSVEILDLFHEEETETEIVMSNELLDELFEKYGGYENSSGFTAEVILDMYEDDFSKKVADKVDDEH